MFRDIPDDTLEREWATFKEFQLGDTELTAREKHLIGYAVAAATFCPYCTYFHQAATTMLGTTAKQLEEARRIASETAKWSTYIHGQQTDLQEFRHQTDEIGAHLARKAEGGPTRGRLTNARAGARRRGTGTARPLQGRGVHGTAPLSCPACPQGLDRGARRRPFAWTTGRQSGSLSR